MPTKGKPVVATDEEAVTIYAIGICALSCCVAHDLTPDKVEAIVNRLSPTGIGSPWRVHDPTFADGSANPHTCEQSPDRMHYVLHC